MRLNTDRGERPAGEALSEEQEQASSHQALAALAVKLEALRMMTVSELQQQHRLLFGEVSRTRNREFLMRKLGWRIQVAPEAALPSRVRDRIKECLDEHLPVPVRGLEPTMEFLEIPTAPDSESTAPSPTVTPPPECPAPRGRKRPRDPRLPPPGTVLKRVYLRMVHEVIVLKEGFEYRGKHEPTLSRIARRITGSPWNGFAFFGLPTGKPTTPANEEEANPS